MKSQSRICFRNSWFSGSTIPVRNQILSIALLCHPWCSCHPKASSPHGDRMTISSRQDYIFPCSYFFGRGRLASWFIGEQGNVIHRQTCNLCLFLNQPLGWLFWLPWTNQYPLTELKGHRYPGCMKESDFLNNIKVLFLRKKV